MSSKTTSSPSTADRQAAEQVAPRRVQFNGPKSGVAAARRRFFDALPLGSKMTIYVFYRGVPDYVASRTEANPGTFGGLRAVDGKTCVVLLVPQYQKVRNPGLTGRLGMGRDIPTGQTEEDIWPLKVIWDIGYTGRAIDPGEGSWCSWKD
jgi:hypothetical protein